MEAGDIKLGSSLDFRTKVQKNSDISYQRITQQAGFVTQAVPASGGTESIFQIPNKVWNPSESFLSFIYYPGAGGGGFYNYLYNDCCAPIRQLQFYTKNGLMLVDVPDLANFTKMTWKSQLALSDYLTFERYEDARTTDNSAVVAGGVAEVQRIGITTAATAGNFVFAFAGVLSDPFTFNDVVGTLNTRLNAMSSMVGNGLTAVVTGVMNAINNIDITFGQQRPIKDEFGFVNILPLGIATALVQVNPIVQTQGVWGPITDRGTWGKLLRPSNNLKSSFPARRPDGSPASVDYIENQYVTPGYLVNAVGPYIKVKLPLSMIVDSFLSLNKSLSLGDISYLRIVWQSSAKIGYIGTSITNPLTGAAAMTAGYTYNQLYLYIATEQNPQVYMDVNDIVNNEGLRVSFPWIKYNKINLAGGSQTVPIIYTQSDGKRLTKIYHSLFNNTESANTAYDNSNTFNPTTPANQRIQQFFTAINGDRRQGFDLLPRNNEDYMFLYQKLKGSLYVDPGIFQYNWVWIEDFTDEPSPQNKILENGEINLKGLPLLRDLKFEFNGVSLANANYNHYTYGITQREILIKKGEVMYI